MAVVRDIVREVVRPVVNPVNERYFNWPAWWATLISATVEDAAPTNVVLTFPTAKTSLIATDFTIAGFTINSASWAGAVLTLVLSTSVVYGDVLVVTFVRTGQTANVTNNTLWSTYWLTQQAVEQAEFITQGYGSLICFGLPPFTNTSVPTNYDPDLFNPTEDISDSIDEWLDDIVAAGMKYAILTCNSVEGFALWPTTYYVPGFAVFGIEVTTWYSTHGSPDVVKLFTDGCRARNLKIGFYYCIWNTTFETRYVCDSTAMNAVQAAEYTLMVKTQLNELLSNYGIIDYLWLDGWGYHVPYTAITGIPYNDLREYIGNRQRDCLVINNNPGTWPNNSDIKEHETWLVYPIVGNTDPSENVASNLTGGLWFYYSGFADLNGIDRRNAASFYTSAQIYNQKVLVNARTCNFLLGTSPNTTGLMNVYERIAFLGANPLLLVYPLFATAETDTPTIVTINFIKTLDGASVPAVTDFALAGKTISNVAIVGNTVLLTVTVAYALGDVITVNYTKPGVNMLKDTVGNQVASFTALPVTNNIVATDIPFLLTKTGTGLGVATLVMASSEDVLITLGANAKFYSDAAGTLDESATWTVTAGAYRTRYIRCSTGTATFVINKNKITKWGTSTTNGWVSSINAPSIGGDISKLTALTQIRITGLDTFSGSLITLPNVTYLRIANLTTITGDLTSMTALTYIALGDSNTVSGDIGLISNGLQNCVCGTNASRVAQYTSGGDWSEMLNGSTIQIIPPAPFGLDSTEVDNLIIEVAATMTPGRAINIYLQGNCEPRTAASDAAKAAIIAAGGTVTTN